MNKLKTNIKFRFFLDLMEDLNKKCFFFGKLQDPEWFPVLKEHGFFDYKENDGFDSVLRYLLKVFDEIENEKIISIIKKNLHNTDITIDYHSMYNFWDLIFKLKPEDIDFELVELIKRKDMEDNGYPCNRIKLFEKIIKSNKPDYQIIKSLLEFFLYFKKNQKKYSYSNEYSLNTNEAEILNNNFTLIAKYIVKDYDFLIKKLIDGIQNDSFLFRSSNLFSIKNNSEDNFETNRPEHILIFLIRECLSLDNESEKLIKKFLNGDFKDIKYVFFHRLALYTIDQKWQQTEYQNLFWSFLDYLIEEQKKPEIDYIYSYYEKELFDLFKNHYDEMIKNNKKKKIDQFLNSLDELATSKDIDKKTIDREKKIKTIKNVWLNAFIDCEPFKTEYTIEKIEESEFIEPYVRSGWVQHKSPILKADLSNLTINEQAKYLIELPCEFKNEWNNDNFIEYSKEGLANIFSELIYEKPEAYNNELNLFIDIEPIFLIAIIDTYKKILDDENKINHVNWFLIINYIEKINKKNSTIDNSVLRHTGWFLKDFIFKYELLNENSNLIDQIYSATTDQIETMNLKKATIEKDFVSETLNNPIGIYYDILFLLLINLKKYDCDVQKLLVKELNKDDNVLFFNVLGKYFENVFFFYKNKKLLDLFNDEILKPLISNNNNFILKSFIEGYLYLSCYHIPEVYNNFKDNIYKHIIKEEYNDYSTTERFTMLLVGNWLYRDDDYLLKLVLDTQDANKISFIIELLIHNETVEEFKIKRHKEKNILDFWQTLYVFEKDKNSLNEKEQDLVRKSMILLAYVDENNIGTNGLKDFIFNKVVKTGCLAVNDRHLYKNVEYLSEFAPDLAYEINYELLEQGHVPRQHNDNLFKIIQNIYKQNPVNAEKLAKKYVDINLNYYSNIFEWWRNLGK